MLNILSKEKFSNEVLELIKQKNYDVIDALLDTAEKYEINPEEIKSYISSHLESLLFQESQRKNLLMKMNTLF